jgi:hypothetical protein
MLRKISCFVLLLLAICLIGKGWHKAKNGFSFSRIGVRQASHVASPPEWKGVLDQPYHYLGHGHQCYAFASADGKYVLKFPRMDVFRLPFWLKSCSFAFLEKMRQSSSSHKAARFDFLTRSFGFAGEELREETGILLLHLEPTKHLNGSATIVDRFGRSYQLDLDRSVYVVQKKVPLMMPIFLARLEGGDREGAKRVLNDFLELLSSYAKRKICFKDPSFLRNFGYEEKGYQIDIGSFYPVESFDASLKKTAGHVREWLGGIDPEIEAWFSSRVDEISGANR